MPSVRNRSRLASNVAESRVLRRRRSAPARLDLAQSRVQSCDHENRLVDEIPV